MAFIFTIDTTQAGTTNTSGFQLPLIAAGSYDFFIDWGDGGGEDNITVYNQAERTHQYALTGIYQISITGVGLTGWQFNDAGDDDKLLTIDEWGSDVLTINNTLAFYGCSNLTTAATGSPNIIGSMVSMFQSCPNFVSGVKDFDMSQVTSTNSMFRLCTNFDDDLSNWDVSGVADMWSMFRDATSFNQNIQPWNPSNVTNASAMFLSATAFNNGGLPMTGMDWSSCSVLSLFFQNASAFNQPVSGWNISSATNLDSMFYETDSFNQDISDWTMPTGNCTAVSMFQNNNSFNNGGVSMSSWDTSKITDMNAMFYNAIGFNQAVSGWDVSGATNMFNMFRGATSFNQNIQPWNPSNVTNASAMFLGATAFNNGGLPMTGMDWSSCSTFGSMFYSATGFNQPVSGWDISSATNIGSMFYEADSFNQDISDWTMPTANCTAVSMFQNSNSFNNGGVSMSSWDTSKITDMDSMFYNAIGFNQAVSGWDVSGATRMWSMFRGATSFNQNIQPWNPSNVTDASAMFLDATAFNNGGLPMTGMDWSSCSVLSLFFQNANAFNQPVSGWNISSATNLNSMFYNGGATSAVSFNQDISDWTMPTGNCTAVSMFQNHGSFNNGGVSMSSWDTSKITNMDSMFYSATGFNQAVSGWDVSSVTNMSQMLRNTAFDQTLSGWNISNVTNIGNFLLSSELSCDNYDSTLQYWATLDLTNSLSFNGGTSTYTPLGSGAKQSIIDNDLWTFVDGGVVTIGPLGISFTVDIDGSGFYTVNNTTGIIVSAIGTGQCTDTTTLGSTYQWYKTTGTDVTAGVAIDGATSATYSYTPILDDDGSGLYAVSVSTNDYGSFTGTGTVQLLYIGNSFIPDEDLSNSGNWSPTPIFEQIDADDINLVTSPLTPSNDSFEVGLTNGTNYDPSGSTFIVSRFRKVTSGGQPTGNGDTIDLTIELVQTGTILETFNYNDVNDDNLLTYSVVSQGAKDSIGSDFTDISLRVFANASVIAGGGLERAVEVSFLSIDAGAISDPVIGGGAWPYSGMPVMTGIDGTDVARNAILIANYAGKSGGDGLNYRAITWNPPTSGAITYLNNLLANRFRGRYRG